MTISSYRYETDAEFHYAVEVYSRRRQAPRFDGVTEYDVVAMTELLQSAPWAIQAYLPSPSDRALTDADALHEPRALRPESAT